MPFVSGRKRKTKAKKMARRMAKGRKEKESRDLSNTVGNSRDTLVRSTIKIQHRGLF